MSRPASAIRTSTRLAIWFRDGFTCVYCGAVAPGVRLSLDHVRISRPEDHRPANLVTACIRCNSSRQAQSVTAFCGAQGLHKGTIWRRIRCQTKKPLEGYRSAVNLILSRGVPDWLTEIRQGSVPSTDSDIPF